MILTFLGFLARVGVFISAIITLGLNGKFFTNTDYSDDLLIYIIALASFSALACLVPPYPNFVYDLFWALANAICAVFALVVQFIDSECYGFRADNGVKCATYKAGTAFTFLLALAWFASAFFGGLRILGVVFNIGQYASRPLYIQGAEDDKEAKVKNGDNVEPEKKKKIKGYGNNHVARYFVCYGLLGVALLAAGLPLLIIYAAPAFAIYLLDHVPIPNVQVNLLNPTNDSIQFSVLSDIKVPDAVSVRFDPMQALFFRAETKDDPIPIATVDLPSLKFAANERVSLVNQSLKLGDVDQFAALVEDVAYNPTFRVAGQTKTRVHVGTLGTTVDLLKVVSLPGFNNFPNLWINEIGVMPPDDQGNNVYGEVVVFNPAPATVTLGEVTLGVILADLTVGQATVAVNDIVPGNNTFVVRAKLNTELVENNINEIIKSEIPYLKEGNVIATATGISVVYNGQHLEYWEKAFQTIRVSATRPVKEILNMVVDSGVSFILGGIKPGDGLETVVNNLVDQILDTVRGLDENDVDGYTENLAALGKLVLRLLTFLGIL
ncbi:uncharacterized protein APUU_21589A [Aspergillus puulaauensis]|uniref:Uncharacterized protein n=1 Tax=Aspergillus puulaauensis TaxID=1220207 RepID=A0A7R7XGL7_9EURO|nr:uncharacterized protein APUU_21589A [Aspergillus puulaauensis]BCS21157.1 hypothetical protein APUU_21589A [Aspergillus puulaauensis]